MRTPTPWYIIQDGSSYELRSHADSRSLEEWRKANPEQRTYFSGVLIGRIQQFFNGGGPEFGPSALIGMDETKANADFIIRACNAHDDLLAALKAIIAWQADPQKDTPSWERRLYEARAAIAKADGRES